MSPSCARLVPFFLRLPVLVTSSAMTCHMGWNSSSGPPGEGCHLLMGPGESLWQETERAGTQEEPWQAEEEGLQPFLSHQ